MKLDFVNFDVCLNILHVFFATSNANNAYQQFKGRQKKNSLN